MTWFQRTTDQWIPVSIAYGIWGGDGWLHTADGRLFVFYNLGAARAQLEARPSWDRELEGRRIAVIKEDGQPEELQEDKKECKPPPSSPQASTLGR